MTSQAVTPEIDALLTRADDLLRRFDPPHVSHLAIPLLRRAVAAAPERIDLHFRLARALHRIGDGAGARTVCDGILSRWPEAVEARLFRAIAWIPILYDHEDEILPARAAFLAGIQELHNDIRGDMASLRRLANWAGRVYPYHLPYAALDDIEHHRAYGRLMGEAMAVAYPAYAKAIPMPPTEGRIRAGIASRHFRRHANWRSIIRGWMYALDSDRFEVIAYDLGNSKPEDICTIEARGLAARYVAGERSLDEWAKTICGDRLHVLLYPSIGEYRDVTALAMLRLAPLQILAMGHCTTSGLQTIDYMLSGDLAEPDEADRYYTEKLIRLPNLGFHYSRPDSTRVVRDRGHFNIRASSTVFLAPNSLVKCLPQYDDIYARIAAASGDCQIVFVMDAALEAVSRRCKKRIEAAFLSRGLEPAWHLLFLPRQKLSDFHDLQRLSDVYLDSIGWTGGTSTAMALGLGLPMVTLKGSLFRSRMGFAMLHRLGLDHLVAAGPDEYVRIAVHLGKDAAYRAEIRAHILARCHRLYDDDHLAENFGDVVLDVVRKAGQL
ncbi:hypothetical protein P7L70_02355 (plasmid) [Tistrella mobilis]|uniref:O-linked N-acetylglucosamine transferase, SPINDLY family protein n=1 Tax=Tistrella mobilis TaxID=171437 RepID=UPI003557FF02